MDLVNMALKLNEEIDIKSELFDDPLSEHDNELHEEIDIKSETIDEHDTEFDSNELEGQNITLSDSEMDTYNIEIGVKPFEFVEVEIESLLAEPVTDNPLTCEKSNEEFSSHENLQELASHDKVIKCSICYETFDSQSSLNSHLLTHDEFRPYICHLCSFKSTQRSYLKKHLVNIHNLCENSVASLLPPVIINKKIHKCEKCNLTFKTNLGLKRHIYLLHDVLRPFKCNLCGACFTTTSNLNSHVTIHAGEKPYKCSICSQDFRLKKGLQCHLIRKHKIIKTGVFLQKNKSTTPVIVDEKEHTCEISNVQFSSHENLNKHTHDKVIKCSICNETFDSQSSLNSHLLTHAEFRPYTCHLCSFKSTQRSYLKKHLVNIHNLCENSVASLLPPVIINKKIHKCEKCNLTFKTNLGLKRHIYLLHDVLRPFKCNLCGACFTTTSNLNSHVTIHAGEKPYKCSICSQDFRLKKGLQCHLIRKHKIIKTGVFLQKNKSTTPVIVDEKEHTCEISNVQFSSHENLNKHTHDKVIKCSICNETFGGQSSLNSHLLTHAEFRPYTCHLCSFKSTQRSYLKKHLVNIHNLCENSVANLLPPIIQSTFKSHLLTNAETKPYICPVCSFKFKQRSDLKKHLLKAHKFDENSAASLLPPPINKTHKCEKCPLTFESKDSLEQHILTCLRSRDIRPFKFNSCGACFKKKQHLKSHSTKHSGEKIYKCSICSKDFRWKSGLKRHLIKVHQITSTADSVQNKQSVIIDQKEHTCERCSVQFSSYETLRQHINSVHKATFELCSICKLTFMSQSELNDHLCTHHPNNTKETQHLENLQPTPLGSFKCTFCNLYFTLKSSLTEHLSLHYFENKNKCFVCSKEFVWKNSLRFHLCKAHGINDKSVIENSLKPLEKPSIGKVRDIESNSSSIQQEVNTVHKNLGQFKCSTCDKNFKRRTSLIGHLRTHENTKPLEDARKTNLINVDNVSPLANSDNSNYQCDICHIVCISLDELKEHKIVHSKISSFSSPKCFKCDKCDMIDIFENLEKHIAAYHTEDSSFTCSVCKASFNSVQNLKIHLNNIHEKPIEVPQNVSEPMVSSDSINESVKCEICKQDFNNRTSLKCHFNKMHTNNKDLKCDLCGKTYWRDGILQRHCDNFHKTANLTSGLQHSPPKPQLRQSVTRNKVRQPDCKLTASSLPEMWITKVKPCCVLLDRGDVTRYLSRLDKREVTEERGSPIEGLPPPLATPAPPVRDDPRHPCGAVSVTSDLLLGAATSTLENVRREHNYSK